MQPPLTPASPSQTPVSTDERLMGGLAHLVGFFLALLLWVLNRDRSPFVRFHALQAAAFDGVILILFILGAAGLFAAIILIPIGYILAMAISGQPHPIPEVGVFLGGTAPVMIVAFVAAFSGFWLGVRLWAAIAVFSGRDFRYPFIGRKVEEFLSH